MNPAPLASTIIPSFNYARFLGEAIDSALAQDYPAHEVIVVDDGSTDDSRAVIESYGDRIVPVFQGNRGQAAAFSAGISASRGELIFPLDADDVFLPGRISTVVNALSDLDAQDRDAVSLVRTRMAYWTAPKAGTPLPSREDIESHIYKNTIRGRALHPRVEADRALPCRLQAGIAGSALVRSKIEGFLPVPLVSQTHASDTFWSTMARIVGSVLDVPETLALYRLHGSSLWNSQSKLARLDSQVRTEIEIFEYLVSLGHSPYMRFVGILGSHRVSAETADLFPLKTMRQRLKHLMQYEGPKTMLIARLVQEVFMSLSTPSRPGSKEPSDGRSAGKL